jgi:hypothetical protein
LNFDEILEKNSSSKDKFISRFFGIFNEEVASLFFQSPYSKYENLGRPTIWKNNKHYTLDFTLKSKETNNIYICEMKCEMQYMNYKRLELKDAEQIDSHTKEAFKIFLDIPNNKNAYKIDLKNNGKRKVIEVDGIILLWGKTTDNKNHLLKLMEKYKFIDIISLEELINIMISKNYKNYFIKRV